MTGLLGPFSRVVREELLAKVPDLPSRRKLKMEKRINVTVNYRVMIKFIHNLSNHNFLLNGVLL